MAAGPAALRGARVGERWVLRLRLPDGSATDVVDWLVEVGPTRVAVSSRPEPIDLAQVVVARRAPAAAGGRSPAKVAPDELARRTLPGWLAWSEPLGEWTLRFGGGFTGRANSCQAVGDPGMSPADAAARIVAYADQHGIPPLAQAITGSDPDRALTALGWVETYEPTAVLAVRLADLLGTTLPDRSVGVSEELGDAWRAAYHRSRPNDADPAVLEMILAGHPPRAFGSVGDDDGQPLAIARGHVDHDWLGLAAIWTDPDHRRRGLATQIIMAVGHWAARRGARYAYLQVASANTGAITAYGRLGFQPHHAYRYLRPPGDGGRRLAPYAP